MSVSNSITDQNKYTNEDDYEACDFSSSNYISCRSSNGISEIEEEHEDEEKRPSCSLNGEIDEIRNKFAPMPSIKEEHDKRSVSSVAEDSVYVAVGKSFSSEHALDWALRNTLKSSSTIVYLIHIFPETKQIPTPLGKLQLSQVSPEQVETYMAQERGKRRELLQKFLSRCSDSNVNVDTILIESDGVPKAILDLVDILNIRKLVVGTTKSSLRKLRSRKGTGTVDQILKGAPETCELKIVCEGFEVMLDQAVESPSHRDFDISKEFNRSKSIRGDRVDEDENLDDTEKHEKEATMSCMCFK